MPPTRQRLCWPAGFVCPASGGSRGWAFATKAHTHECADDCRKQTPVTAGRVMRGSQLALTAWFWFAGPMATHSSGISALNLQTQLDLGYYDTAWLLITKPLRQAAPRLGRTAAHVAGELGRGGRKSGRPTLQGRPAERWRQAQPPRQAVDRRRCRGRRRWARPDPPGADRGLLRRQPARLPWAPTSPSAPPPGPTAGPSTPARPASQVTPHRRKPGRPCRSAPGSSRLHQPRDPGAGRLLRPPTPTPAMLPRRARLPLQPAPIPPRRHRSAPGIGVAIKPTA